MKLYIVLHKPDSDTTLLEGVFSTKAAAEKAVSEYKASEYAQYDEFYIAERKLDEMYFELSKENS